MTRRKCDLSWLVSWLIILLPRVGWDIMGYEWGSLPSSPKLRKWYHSVKLITPLPWLFLRLIYHVLIPPVHHPEHPWHPLRLRAQCIYRPAGHPLLYGRLPPLDVYADGLEPRGVHRLLYCWILPISACPIFRCRPRDPLLLPMVERRQDLEHLPGHHADLSSIH